MEQNFTSYPNLTLAMSYTNIDIVEKFSFENNLNIEISHEYFNELKKYLYLCSISNKKLAPSEEIDKIWHTFILFTKDYRFYCSNYLGRFIDHVPKVSNSISEENYLQNTITLYHDVFGKLNNNVWHLRMKKQVLVSANCEGDCQSESSCVYTGNCFNCTDSGQNCVGENPNDL